MRERVIPAYMGLIRQIDDQLGHLWAYMRARGLFENSLVVFTSDHGDYLGDHWLGEKELFHEPSVKIPLIVRDPRREAVRGQVRDELVEAIDLVPTFVEALGGTVPDHILEGRSLMPLLAGERPGWRRIVFSEYDYSMRRARRTLGVPIGDARCIMAFDGRWKLVHVEGMRPMLHGLAEDPHEFHDRGADPSCAPERARLMAEIDAWARRHHNRVTITDAEIAARAGKEFDRGILIGFWDEAEVIEARETGARGDN